MAQVEIIGRVTADIELQTSQNKNPFVRFSIAETIGYGNKSRTQYADVWAWGQFANQLVRRKVHKGSLIRVNGSLELERFLKLDGVTTDKRLKVKLESWGYIDSGKPDNDTQPDSEPKTPPKVSADIIDGEREPLPE